LKKKEIEEPPQLRPPRKSGKHDNDQPGQTNTGKVLSISVSVREEYGMYFYFGGA